MIRKIVKIDEEKCNGCGVCVPACAEGALKVIDGKVRLISEVFCDGLGACLGECPQDAITIEEREADAFDEETVKGNLSEQPAVKAHHTISGDGCPGSAVRVMPETTENEVPEQPLPSRLGHWPVQLTLVPPTAPFLEGAHILVCADCVPFAFADFHRRYLAGHAVLVGCPKLDDLSYYREKLTDIFREAQPASITVLRMEVPCCGGIAHAAIEARNRVAPDCPMDIHTITVRGEVHEECV